MLEVLELDNCSLLTSVSLDLPRLQNIRLVHCRNAVSNCPHMINITKCTQKISFAEAGKLDNNCITVSEFARSRPY
ncbi:hypothetical protein HAX54_034923 [Datura stramonium]|uniref:Uncharacterized protein n=1 Tax=Datura stramonium TaxID=4076 RepID=A0ABS8SEN4_DATST|nr:hypothetical protein [Datura stramonium]